VSQSLSSTETSTTSGNYMGWPYPTGGGVIGLPETAVAGGLLSGMESEFAEDWLEVDVDDYYITGRFKTSHFWALIETSKPATPFGSFR
jgi:hypothetical protein